MNIKRLRLPEDRAKLVQGPLSWTVDELAVLYRYATNRERALILLGLNFGFAQAETLTLLHTEIDRTSERPKLKRLRHKTDVYLEAEVWPETLAAVDWLIDEQRRLKAGGRSARRHDRPR